VTRSIKPEISSVAGLGSGIAAFIGDSFSHGSRQSLRCPDDPSRLEQLSAKGSVRKAGDEFVVEAKMEGASARELNRTFLSALRKVEKRTTLRAEWTSSDGTTERFFDYVLTKTIRN
jgi:hypothetical protein